METKGEKLNFYKLFTEKTHRVKIPILQRDYAHGRESAKEIRNEFLENLKKHLKKKENIDLDFIYGSLKGNDKKTLILLDGQQRITTLFLLHWYLANKEGCSNKFQEFMLTESEGQKKSNFTYETRTSSRDFCDQLVSENIDFDNLIDDKISKTIENQPWFFRSWTKDPTVKSMLNMLDDIHKKFYEKKDEENLFDLLVNESNESLITFQFLNLDKFELTDELYIKMNSRGKQLTPFENFKAKLEGYIKTADFNKADFNKKYILDDRMKKYFSDKEENKMKKYFSYKIDNQWTDFFWKYKDTNKQENSKDNSFDDELSNFIRSIFTYQYILDKKNIDWDDNEDDNKKNLELLLDTNPAKRSDNYTKIISFQRYQEMEVVNEKAVEHLINAFDVISNYQDQDEFKSLFDDYFYYNSERIFKKILNHDLTYKQRLKFFAYLKFLMVKVYPKKDIENEVEFKEWMRVVHNLVERTPIPDSYAFYRAIRSIEEMIDYSSEILDYLKDSDNEISFYSDRQVQEERIKAELIQKSDEWELIIKEAEQDSYYKGEIAFLLEFSGILEYYERNGNCGWSKSDNKCLDDFEKYKEKALAVSSYMSKGKDEKQKNYDFLFERAVLTKGDYLLEGTASRKNLLSTDSKKNGNTRWKDLLRLSGLDKNNRKEKKTKRGYIKDLFDDLGDKSFEFKNLEESLKNICDNSSENDWRNLLINNPKLIDYCNKGYLAFRGEEGKEEIYLYKESQSNHYHRELYSYSFYLDYLSSGKDFMPFQNVKYHSVKSRSDDPNAVLDNWKKEDNNYEVNIRYLADSQEYELRFFNKESSAVDNKIVDILSYMGYEKADKTKETNCFYFNRFKSDDETIKKLKSLCSELNKLDL